MVRPDGAVVSVPIDKVSSYLLLGYRQQELGERIDALNKATEAANYGGFGQGALTAVEGGLSGATLGLSDIAEGALLGHEGMRKRAEYHPGLRLGSEILGAILPAIGTGGATLEESAVEEAGAVSRLLSKAPSAVLSRGSARLGERLAGRGIAGKVVAGAAEGAVYGASGEITRTQLTGDPLTIEGTLASTGMGLAFGGALGGIGGGLEGLGELSAARKARRLEQEALDAMGGRRIEVPHEYTRDRRIVLPDSPPNPFPKATSSAEARAMASEGILPQERYAPFQAAVSDLRATSKRLVADAEAAHEAAVKAGKAVDKGHIVMPDKPIQGPVQDIKARGDSLYSEAFAANFKTPEGVSYKSQAASLRSYWGHLSKAMAGGNATKIEAQLAKYTSAVELLGKAMGKGAAEATAAKTVSKSVKSLVELQHAVETLHSLLPSTSEGLFAMSGDKAEQLAAAVGGVMKSKVPEAIAVQGTIKAALESLAETVGVANKDASPAAALRSTWAAGHAARDSAAKGWEAATAVRKPTIEYGHLSNKTDVGSRYKNPESLYPTNKTKAKNRAKLEPEADNHGSDFIKRYLVKRAAGALVGGLIGNQFGTAQSATGAIVGALLAGKGATMQRVSEAAGKISTKVGKALRVSGPKSGLYRSLSGVDDPGKDLRDAFNKRSAEIRAMAANAKNQAFVAAMAFHADGHPEFAKGMYDQAVRVQALLQERLPKDPPGTRWGTEYLWSVPPEQLVVFNQEYQAITDPASFIEEAVLAPGAVFPSAVDALEKAWPGLYSKFKAEGLVNLAIKGTQGMSHGDLAAYSVIFKTPLAPTMSPEFIQDTVAMFSPENAPPKPQAQGAGASQPGASSEATQAQLLENRGSLA